MRGCGAEELQNWEGNTDYPGRNMCSVYPHIHNHAQTFSTARTIYLRVSFVSV